MGIPYKLQTRSEKLVMDYTRLSIVDVQEMDLDIYLFFMREAYIHELSQTEDGRKYLDDCWRISQTKVDRIALHEKVTRKGG